MISDRDVLICSDDAIDAFKQRRSTIPAEIKGWENIKDLEEEQAGVLSNEINGLNREILKLDTILKREGRKISDLESDRSSLQEVRYKDHGHHPHEHHRHPYPNLAEIHRISNEISTLKKKLASIEEQRRILNTQRDTVTRKFNEHKRQANIARNKIADLLNMDHELSNSIEISQTFLQQLQNSPENLCHSMVTSLQQQIKQHEEKHPHNQSETVRIALRTLPIKLRCILEKKIRDDGNATREWQIKYAILCGLFWQTAKNLNQQSAANEAFIIEFRKLMIKHVHIANNGDLPNRVDPTNRASYQLYVEFQRSNADKMSDMTPEMLKEIELTEYNTTYKAFEITLGPKEKPQVPSEVHKIGMDALENTKKLIAESITPDIKFYTTALKQLDKTVKNPDDKNLRKCRDLAKVAPGVPSRSKIFAGILLLCAATIVTVGSFFIALASFGAAAPASALGIALGASTAVKAVSLITCAAGIGAAVASCGLFKWRGLSKNLWDISKVETPAPWTVTTQRDEASSTTKPTAEPSAPSASILGLV